MSETMSVQNGLTGLHHSYSYICQGKEKPTLVTKLEDENQTLNHQVAEEKGHWERIRVVSCRIVMEYTQSGFPFVPLPPQKKKTERLMAS